MVSRGWGSPGGTLAWFLPYGFYAEREYDVRIRIMTSLESSLEEQMSQVRRSAIGNIAPPLSGESVLDVLVVKVFCILDFMTNMPCRTAPHPFCTLPYCLIVLKALNNF